MDKRLTYEELKDLMHKDSEKPYPNFVYPVVNIKHGSKFIGTVEKAELLRIIKLIENAAKTNGRIIDQSRKVTLKTRKKGEKKKSITQSFPIRSHNSFFCVCAQINIRYNKISFIIVEDTPLQQLHMFFITAHLRFAFVTKNGTPVGLVTREDITNALKKQHNFA